MAYFWGGEERTNDPSPPFPPGPAVSRALTFQFYLWTDSGACCSTIKKCCWEGGGANGPPPPWSAYDEIEQKWNLILPMSLVNFVDFIFACFNIRSKWFIEQCWSIKLNRLHLSLVLFLSIINLDNQFHWIRIYMFEFPFNMVDSNLLIEKKLNCG